VRLVARALHRRLDVVGRTNATRRALELGADLIRRVHSLALGFFAAVAGFDSTAGLAEAAPPSRPEPEALSRPVEDSGLPAGESAAPALAEESLAEESLAEESLAEGGAVWDFLPSLP